MTTLRPESHAAPIRAPSRYDVKAAEYRATRVPRRRRGASASAADTDGVDDDAAEAGAMGSSAACFLEIMVGKLGAASRRQRLPPLGNVSLCAGHGVAEDVAVVLYPSPKLRALPP